MVPDLITTAKSLGSGAPIGVVISRDPHVEKMKGKLHFNTFGGNPYQAMQALKVVEIIEEEKLIKNSMEMGNYLKDGFNKLKEKFSIIGDVRGRGLLLGMELVEDASKTPATTAANKLMEITKSHNLLIEEIVSPVAISILEFFVSFLYNSIFLFIGSSIKKKFNSDI